MNNTENKKALEVEVTKGQQAVEQLIPNVEAGETIEFKVNGRLLAVARVVEVIEIKK